MKDKLFQKAINWTQRKGFNDIKANTEDFDTPRVFTQNNGDETVVPDITGRMHGSRSYIEIVSKEADKQSLISKWKLFCKLTAGKGGKLYLLAARGHKTFAENIVKNYNLYNAKVVSI